MSTDFITPTPVFGVGVFIATPTFHAPHTAYTWSLARTTAELARRGIPFQLGIPDDVKNVDDGRNGLVREFLAGNCTDILFIDSDMRWEPESVLRILSWDEDLVAGAYRFKSDSGSYPVGRIFGADEKTGLLDVSYAPTGFMRIRRRVFEQLAPSQRQSGATKFFFMRQFNENTYDGGDVNFCRKWIGAGGKVKIDPKIWFEHVGDKRWGGRFSDYLANPENAAKHMVPEADKHVSARGTDLSDAIEELKQGNGESSVFAALADAYGNSGWALTPEGLETIWRMATNLEPGQLILELGSGISTVVLAAAAASVGAKLITFEDDREWAKKTCALLDKHGLDAEIQVRPIVDNWYDTRELPDKPADLLIVDGPPRGASNGRPVQKPFTIPNLVADRAAVFFDDVSMAQVKNVEGAFVDVNAGKKPMVVGRMGDDAKLAMGQ